MLGRTLNPRTHHSLWVVLGFVCCALVAFTAMVQVAHTHADGQAVQSDCALCHTAHVVVQPSLPQSLPHTVRIVATISTALQPIRPKHFAVFSLFTRPPPVDIAFA
jgi:hypothetical protein